MELATSGKAAGRFATLLASDVRNNQPHDRPLLEGDGWVVAPTLGAIIPNWAIVVPRKAELNFCDWGRSERGNPIGILAEIVRSLAIGGNRLIWFEHGARRENSLVGCGVDYAHLHVLIDAPFSQSEFVAKARAMAALSWRTVDSDVAYSTISDDVSYLTIGTSDHVAIAENVDFIGSQFLRRVVASIVGKPDAWNYRTTPEFDNIAQTIAFYSAQRDAAHRDQ